MGHLHFMAEVIAAAWDRTPAGWARCDGGTLAVADYPDLFALIGTVFGGDGITTFDLPDLRGRVIVHEGDGYTRAWSGGAATHQLTTAEMPTHEHELRATSAAGVFTAPGANALAEVSDSNVAIYRNAAPDVAMHADSIDVAGGNAPHNNMQPYLVLNYFICLNGKFPVQ